MKKLAALLAVLIVLSGISPCSFASQKETTECERDAYRIASNFLDNYVLSVSHIKDYDPSDDTFAFYDNSPLQIKNEILSMAKKYEEEIRNTHLSLPYEDSKTIFKQYSKVTIEEILASFPVFIQKKTSYMRAVSSYDAYKPNYRLSPISVTVSESGFSYVNYGECHVLLYKCTYDEDFTKWLVCDVIYLHDEYDEKYRFHSEDMDVDKELISNGYTPATDDELSAQEYASGFLGKCETIKAYHIKKLSAYTMAHLDDSQKRKIIKKAKKYEDEIRDNHHYHFYEDSKDSEPDDIGVLPPAIFDKRPVCEQYDDAAIEDIITSFPIYLRQKLLDLRYDSDLQYPHNSLYNHSPLRVTVSESGFAYVNYGSLYVLLYKYGDPADDEWVVCDVSIFYDRYDEEHRFSPETLSAGKELTSHGYTPWVICGIEAAAVIALAVMLVIKRRKNKRADENENAPEE